MKQRNFTENRKPGKIENNQEQKRLQEEIDFLQDKISQGALSSPCLPPGLEYGKLLEISILNGRGIPSLPYLPHITLVRNGQTCFERGAD